MKTDYLLFVLLNVGDKLVMAGGTITDKPGIAGTKLHTTGGTLILPPGLHPETSSVVRRHCDDSIFYYLQNFFTCKLLMKIY